MNHKLLAIAFGFGILLSVTVTSNVQNSAYAKSIKVDCKDLAVTLITWDKLLSVTSKDQITDIEDELGEDGVIDVTLDVLIDRHLNNLLDEAKNGCGNLDSSTQKALDDIQFKIPP
jgi:hypothetical protein